MHLHIHRYIHRIFKWFHGKLWADTLIILLAIFSVGLLVFELSSPLMPHHIRFIHAIDIVITVVFMLDFFAGFYLAEKKLIYFKYNWPDILAAIPISDGIFRSMRVLRLMRLLRVLRVIARIRRIGEIADALAHGASQYIYLAAVTAWVILSGAIAFFTMEFGMNSRVHTFFDAVWWAVTTATTVGYGDIYPVTTTGRIIGMVLMFFGIGLVGTISGYAGSYFLEKRQKKQERKAL